MTKYLPITILALSTLSAPVLLAGSASKNAPIINPPPEVLTSKHKILCDIAFNRGSGTKFQSEADYIEACKALFTSPGYDAPEDQPTEEPAEKPNSAESGSLLDEHAA